MNLLRSAVISVAMLFLFSPLTYAEKAKTFTECKDSKIWSDFGKYIMSEYSLDEALDRIDDKNRKMRLNLLITGHAFGRLASAVQNQPERLIAFECVQLVLENNNTHRPLLEHDVEDVEFGHSWYWLIAQAAMGMYDKEVSLWTGVENTEPLYDFFGGKIDTPPLSPGPVLAKKPTGKTTTTITKKDPEVVGGGIAAKDPTKIEASEGRCSNWMVSNLKDKDGLNRKAETTAVCTSLEDSGDFKTEYEPINKTCFICNISDWTPIPKGPTGATTSKVGGHTSGASGSVHPCVGNTIPASAYWTLWGEGGGDGRKYYERAGAVCGTNSYYTYSDNLWKRFSCDKGWVNCRLVKEDPITKVVNKGKYTGYHFGKGRYRGARTPTN